MLICVWIQASLILKMLVHILFVVTKWLVDSVVLIHDRCLQNLLISKA